MASVETGWFWEVHFESREPVLIGKTNSSARLGVLLLTQELHQHCHRLGASHKCYGQTALSSHGSALISTGPRPKSAPFTAHSVIAQGTKEVGHVAVQQRVQATVRRTSPAMWSACEAGIT